MSCKPHSATYSLLIIGFLLCSDIFTRLKSMTQMYTTINGFPDNETKPSAMKLLIATSIIHSAYSQKKKKKGNYNAHTNLFTFCWYLKTLKYVERGYFWASTS